MIDDRVADALARHGAVCIYGPKQCGKSTTGRAFANSQIEIGGGGRRRIDPQVLAGAPTLALRGASPRLIDEWQVMPELWDLMVEVLEAGEGERAFIATGSWTPLAAAARHSGIGQVRTLHMRPMTLLETGNSSGQASLRALMSGPAAQGSRAPRASIERLATLIVRGGWPAAQAQAAARQREQAAARADGQPGTASSARTARKPQAGAFARAIVREFLAHDVHAVDDHERDAYKMTRLITAYAQLAEIPALARTRVRAATATRDAAPLAVETIDEYTDVLQRAFLLESIRPWEPAGADLSRLRINRKPRPHFIDPSIPAALLKCSPRGLLSSYDRLLALAKCLALRDLLVYAQVNGFRVRSYRERTGAAVDAVVEAPDGRWGAFECTLGPNTRQTAIARLKALERRITSAGGRPPQFTAVLECLATQGGPLDARGALVAADDRKEATAASLRADAAPADVPSAKAEPRTGSGAVSARAATQADVLLVPLFALGA